MKLGIHLVNHSLPGGAPALASTLAKAAESADEAGCAWFTMMDHWLQMEQMSSAQDPMLEGYTSLGFLAARTSRVRLGLLVTGVTYRNPALLAKIATTVDVLSEGRSMLGIGAAWYEREHRAYGVPFPSVAERFEVLEEALQIVRQMWSDDDGPYNGRHFQLAETICSPRPLQQPHPPILIGGGGEKKTLRLVAKYGDACNLFATSPDEVAHKLRVLAEHCEREGRDYATIEKTILGGDPFADPDGFLTLMEQYARIGVDHVHVMPGTPDPVEYIETIGKTVIPRLADISG